MFQGFFFVFVFFFFLFVCLFVCFCFLLFFLERMSCHISKLKLSALVQMYIVDIKKVGQSF